MDNTVNNKEDKYNIINYIIICYFLNIITYIYLLSLPVDNFISILASLFFLDGLYVEYFLIIVSTFFIKNKKIYLSLILLFLSIQIIQIFSIYYSSGFLPRLAIDNLNYTDLVLNFLNINLLLIFFIFVLFSISILYLLKINKYFTYFFISLSIAFLFKSNQFLEDVVKKENSYKLEINIDKVYPIYSFFKLFLSDSYNEKTEKFSIHELGKLKNLGLELDLIKKYPLMKNNKINGIKHKNKNVILIFSEGVSARTLAPYNQKFADVTKNIHDFSKQSILIENYYNHTAATYRGLHGQLCSIYPKYGGSNVWFYDETIKNINYFCLTDIFKENNYNSFFLDAHVDNISGIDELLRHIGFDEVLSATKLSNNFLSSEAAEMETYLSDAQLYRALTSFLEKKYFSKNGEDNPFFLALYTAQTHAWYDVKENGNYYQDGKINVLNTLYNLDIAFGRFWDYFKNSNYFNNTIIIFTSDHAHFQENSYIELMKNKNESDYQKLFIDAIPLIIFNPDNKKPMVLDAKYKTSIDFAPSVAHYMGLSYKKNAFVGRSMLITENHTEFGIANYDNEYFLIKNGIVYTDKNSEKHIKTLDLVKKYIKYTQFLELNNRIFFPPSYKIDVENP